MKEFPNKENVRKLALDLKEEHRQFFKRLKKKSPVDLDERVHALHDEAVEAIDCLACANCCSSISPMISGKDIERLSKALRMKPSQIVQQYMHLDEEEDYVFNSAPCPFLLPDRYCSVYEYRPKACREYPHTDRRKFSQILPITLKNCEICPIVLLVVERLREQLG
ncbi:MAG: YkgJ family cysteine cluster protein [Marinilabiliales bacterium]|nr:YkgJ family cysteine cluster protein [Marinilabiliales bacterium]